MNADFEDEYTEERSEPCPEGRGVNLEDFVAYMPAHFYIFTPCREPWVGASVNSRLLRVPVLDQHGRISGDFLSQRLGEPAYQRIGGATDLEADQDPERLAGVIVGRLRGRGAYGAAPDCCQDNKSFCVRSHCELPSADASRARAVERRPVRRLEGCVTTRREPRLWMEHRQVR